MTDYRYQTLVDRTLFAEDAADVTTATTASSVPPPRTSGVSLTCYSPGTNDVVGTLTTGDGGWIDGTLTAPRVEVDTAAGRTPLYSREWVAIRGHSLRPVVHESPDVAAELCVPGDWTVTPDLTRSRWTGTAWEAL